MRYYIATRLEAADRHRELRDALAERGHEVTYDWTQHGSVRHEGAERIRQVAHAEKQGVRDADFVVVLLPGGRGTHSELGLALAMGKRVFIVADIAEGAWAPDERTCAFYHDDLVFRVEYNSQVLPWPEYVHNLANTIHAEVAPSQADLAKQWFEGAARGGVKGMFGVSLDTTPTEKVTPEQSAAEAVAAEHLRYLRDLGKQAFEANIAHLSLNDPMFGLILQMGIVVVTWDALTEGQRDAWTAAAGSVVSAIWSEMEAAVERAQVRVDSPLAPLARHAAALRHREMVDEHFATTRRAGVAVQPPPANADDRETWLLVVEDTGDYLPDDEARTLLRADMRERNRLGKHRYSTPLSPGNGRDSLVDAYQEALDKTVYLKNAVVEMSDTEDISTERGAARKVSVLEEYGEALLAAHRLRALVGTRDRLGGEADKGS